METHWQFSDIEFERHLERCTFPSEHFTHEAHLRLAFVHIRAYGITRAVENLSTQLRAYVKHLGAVDKYNETLTIAAVKVVNHFMLRSQATSFTDLLANYPRLKSNFRALLETHYGFDIYTLPQAKATYIAPDLVPFD